ncbi:uncharacterized protein LOC144329093 [Podarcis muralis]
MGGRRRKKTKEKYFQADVYLADSSIFERSLEIECLQRLCSLTIGVLHCFCSFLSGLAVIRIWMVGHSIVHWAGVAARQSGLGPDLGFPPHIRLSWLSRRGMRWSEFLPSIRRQLLLEGLPAAMVVQLGENDLVSMDCLSLRSAILRDMETLRAMVPTARIFWSKLLQRCVWRGSRCPAATERARKRINSAVAKKVRELGGDAISHPEILFQRPSFFQADGVHLSASGNEAWLGAVVAKLRSWLGL